MLLADPPALLKTWRDLVLQYGVTGFRVHDARYVSAMRCYGITQLMTHNLGDFKDFPIQLIDPMTV